MKPPLLHFNFAASDGVHEFRIELGWFGVERYYVDGLLVHRQWSLLGKTATIASHGKLIQVRSWLEKRQAVMEVRVEGEVVAANLLEEYNKELSAKLGTPETARSKPRGTAAWLLKVAVWIVLALVFFSLLKAAGANAA